MLNNSDAKSIKRFPDNYSVAEMLGMLAEEDPNRPCITHDGVTISRRDFDNKTNRLARTYAEFGVTNGAMVTIGLPNGIEFLEALFAIWKLGATPQPVSYRLPKHELLEIIALAKPSLLIGLQCDDPSIMTLPIGFKAKDHIDDGPLPPIVSRYWKAPTSGGSTGRPKLIVSNLPATAGTFLATADAIGLKNGGVNLITGPLYHNAPLSFCAAGIVFGGHQILMSRFDAALTLEHLVSYEVDWLYMVPTMMSRISKLPLETKAKAGTLDKLRIVFHTAAPCPYWLKKEWIEWLGPDRIWEIYGGTEGLAATFIDGRDWLKRPGSVGRQVFGEIRILDEGGQEVSPGTIGQIWMRQNDGKEKLYHYIGAAAQIRDDGWESLGDLGWFDEEGYLFLSDRLTDMILIGGANIYPAEVEAALDSHPDIISSCIIGLPDDDLGNRAHAIIQVKKPVSSTEIIDHLKEKLAPYKWPRTFEYSEESLRDDAGKVRRSALRKQRMELPAGMRVELKLSC